MNISIQDLAIRLYDLEASFETKIELFSKLFTKNELITLWQECQADLDIGYDDEVYEALKLLGYFKIK